MIFKGGLTSMVPYLQRLPENKIKKLENLVVNLQKKVRKLEKDCQCNANALSTLVGKGEIK